MVEIVFETHAITTDNEAGIATGWLPGRLSARGEELARRMGERHRDAAAVFVSDLARAVETAELAFGDGGIPIFHDWRLRECRYGELDGAPVARLEPRARHVREPFPGGESYADVAARVDSFLDDLARGWDGARVVIVGHSATRWALEHLLRGVPLEELVDAPQEWREGWAYTLARRGPRA